MYLSLRNDLEFLSNTVKYLQPKEFLQNIVIDYERDFERMFLCTLKHFLIKKIKPS